MPGPAGADDPALEQAWLAQLAPRRLRGRMAMLAYGKSRCPTSGSSRSGGCCPGGDTSCDAASCPARGRCRGGGSSDAGRGSGARLRTATREQAARPKPSLPTLTREQREAARLKALQLTGERKQIRAQLQAGELTLAQALAQDEEAAGGMRADTLLRALPGIGAATAAAADGRGRHRSRPPGRRAHRGAA